MGIPWILGGVHRPDQSSPPCEESMPILWAGESDSRIAPKIENTGACSCRVLVSRFFRNRHAQVRSRLAQIDSMIIDFSYQLLSILTLFYFDISAAVLLSSDT